MDNNGEKKRQTETLRKQRHCWSSPLQARLKPAAGHVTPPGVSWPTSQRFSVMIGWTKPLFSTLKLVYMIKYYLINSSSTTIANATTNKIFKICQTVKWLFGFFTVRPQHSNFVPIIIIKLIIHFFPFKLCGRCVVCFKKLRRISSKLPGAVLLKWID